MARGDTSTLRRELVPMPTEVRRALTKRSLTKAYQARPPYQRNDYLGWITGAVRPATRAKRLETMLSELEAGHGYMGQRWAPREQSPRKVNAT